MDAIFLILPDPLMVVGIQTLAPKLNLHLICLDSHPVLELLTDSGLPCFSLTKNQPSIHLRRTTASLLSHPLTLEYIRQHTPSSTRPQILIFKPSRQIELLCHQHHLHLLANSARLNNLFENKIRFHHLLSRFPELWQYLLPHSLTSLSQAKISSLTRRFPLPWVLQFSRGWAGSSTRLINSKAEFLRFKSHWPNRIVKVTPLIQGITLINNACITPHRVLVGPPAVQISPPPSKGHNPKAEYQFTTFGRQWPANIPQKISRQISQTTTLVGQRMFSSGYLGFYGLDFLLSSTGHLFLLECNARLTASLGFYTYLETLNKRTPLLEHHLQSFQTNVSSDELKTKTYNSISGCQLSVRNLSTHSFTPSKQLQPGTYRYHNHQLHYLKPGLAIDDPNSFVLIPPLAKRHYQQNDLLYNLNTLKPLVDTQGRLQPEALSILSSINNQLT